VTAFHDLSADVMHSILAHVQEEACMAGDAVLKAGQPPTKLYLIRHGEVHLLREGAPDLGLSEGSGFGE
jgi:CRP-like cAMP-binding protein